MLFEYDSAELSAIQNILMTVSVVNGKHTLTHCEVNALLQLGEQYFNLSALTFNSRKL